MSRIVGGDDTPGKKRSAHMRSCAEVLRLLAQQASFDGEARDMTAFLVFNLRGIHETIEQSAQAWDDRDYWKKAEALREKWRWTRTVADRLEKLILADRWEDVPMQLIEIIPHFNGITVTTMTRNSDWWVGACAALKKQHKTPT
jgi:hypothetical protein